MTDQRLEEIIDAEIKIHKARESLYATGTKLEYGRIYVLSILESILKQYRSEQGEGKLKDPRERGHFIKRCHICDEVISQCRCMDCNKTKIVGVCAKCFSKPSDKEQDKQIIIDCGTVAHTDRNNTHNSNKPSDKENK